MAASTLTLLEALGASWYHSRVYYRSNCLYTLHKTPPQHRREHMSEDPLEALLNAALDAEPVFAEPVLDEALLHGFMHDVANGIHPAEKIARQYGFASGQHMLKFITDNKVVRRKIKALRALVESDANLEGSNRALAGHALREGMHNVAAPLFDPKATPAVRLDTAKLLARIAGVDGLPAAAKDGSGGASGNKFVVNFLFSGGKTETISATTVVDADHGPARLVMPELEPME